MNNIHPMLDIKIPEDFDKEEFLKIMNSHSGCIVSSPDNKEIMDKLEKIHEAVDSEYKKQKEKKERKQRYNEMIGTEQWYEKAIQYLGIKNRYRFASFPTYRISTVYEEDIKRFLEGKTFLSRRRHPDKDSSLLIKVENHPPIVYLQSFEDFCLDGEEYIPLSLGLKIR